MENSEFISQPKRSFWIDAISHGIKSQFSLYLLLWKTTASMPIANRARWSTEPFLTKPVYFQSIVTDMFVLCWYFSKPWNPHKTFLLGIALGKFPWSVILQHLWDLHLHRYIWMMICSSSDLYSMGPTQIIIRIKPIQVPRATQTRRLLNKIVVSA